MSVHYATKKRAIPESVIQDMRVKYWMHVVSIKKIAENFNLPQSTVRSAVLFENYADLKPPFDITKTRRSWD